MVIYNSAYALQNFVFKYGDEVIEIVNTYKYLGVWCSNKNKIFSGNSAYFSNKASKAIFAIQNYSSETLSKLTPRLALKTFNSLILPILLYCTELMYDGKQIQEIKQIQLTFLKRMLGGRRQTSSLAVYGDTGQFPIKVLQQISVLKNWCHILSLPPESVVRRAYNTLIQLDRLGKQNWVSHVKSLLTEIQLFDC